MPQSTNGPSHGRLSYKKLSPEFVHGQVTQVFGALVDSLTLARSQLNSHAIQQTIDVLSNSRSVAFIGVGSGSANVARDGANRYFRLGIPAEAYADGYLQRMVARKSQGVSA